MPAWKLGLMALLCSVMLTLSAAPFDVALLTLPTLVPLLGCFEQTWKRRLFTGWAAGFLIQAITYYWIFFTIRDFGGLNPALSLTGAGLFFAFQGLDLALWLVVTPALFRHGPVWMKPLGAAASWTVIQVYLFPYVFPWMLGANLNGLEVLRRPSALWGMEGLTFFAVLIPAVCLAEGRFVRPSRNRIFAALGLLVLLLCGHFVHHQPPTRDLRVAVVQPNLIPWAKRGKLSSQNIFLAHYEPTLKLREAEPDLVLWPETAINFPLNRATYYRNKLRELSGVLGAPIITGAIERDDQDRFYNAIFMFTPDGKPYQVYRKERLVLFSERIPWVLSWARAFGDHLGGFSVGQNNRPFFYEDLTILPLVCFEALFPGYVRDKPANLIINLTNDAWFGKTRASALHLQQIRMRGPETGIPMVRATNSGISCWVDTTGAVREPTELYTEALPVYTVPVPLTPQAGMARLGARAVLMLSWFMIAFGMTLIMRHRLAPTKQR